MNENLSLTHEELLICERLRSLRMSGMADAFESQMLDPNADLAPFIERFTEIVNHEWQIRYDKKFKRYLKQAHLRYPDADLDETIYDPARKLDAGPQSSFHSFRSSHGLICSGNILMRMHVLPVLLISDIAIGLK